MRARDVHVNRAIPCAGLILACACYVLSCSGGGGAASQDAGMSDATTGDEAGIDAGMDSTRVDVPSGDAATSGADAQAPAEAGGCASSGTGAIGVVGCPCTSPGALACSGNAQKVTSVCSGGAWSYASTCPRGQNCDSTVGPNQGTCAAIDALCASASPADTLCSDSTTVVQCGPDLLSHSTVQTCPVPACDGGTCTNACVPGETRCASDTQVETCDADGHWQAATCPYACLGAVDAVGGTCGGTCAPGSACTATCSSGPPMSGTCGDTGTCVAGATGCTTACAADTGCGPDQFCWVGSCVKVTAISAGGGQACALTSGGGVQCWGNNGSGELGDNSKTERHLPVAVFGLSSGIVAIAAGQSHTCALTTAGGVLCWGDNAAGELGNNSMTGSSVPVAVSGLSSGVAAIAAGFNSTCAVTTAGQLLCWGANGSGQLGTGSTATTSEVPVSRSPQSLFAATVSTGFDHACAVATSGAAFCWGGNSGYLAGALGTGDKFGYTVPIGVSGLSSGVAAISAGQSHTCALTTAGGVLCSGYNQYGEIGNGSMAESLVPVAVTGLSSGVAAVSAGYYDTCALTTAGAVSCWGWNPAGQLGNNSTTESPVPVAVTGLSSGVAAIATGTAFNCALTTAGHAMCWGSNGFGQLGNNSTSGSLVPINIVEP